MTGWLTLLACATISFFHVAQATTNTAELREYYHITSQALGRIPGCPDYSSIPERVLEQGVDCFKLELSARANGTDYPDPCPTACREFYGYFGAQCLHAEGRAFESYGRRLHTTLAGGSAPVGVDRRLFVSWMNLVLEGGDKVNDIDDTDIGAAIELMKYAPASNAFLIDACHVPTKGAITDRRSLEQSQSCVK